MADAILDRFPLGVLGHYRLTHMINLVALQAAGSRLFSFRNAGANLLVPTRCAVKWIQTAAHTAQILDRLDFFKVTAFSVSDTVSTVTPVASQRRASMVAPPGGAEIRGCTIAGAAAGITGGTLTKDGGTFAQIVQELQAAVPTTPTIAEPRLDPFDEGVATYPFAFANNEGFEIENAILLGAAAGSLVLIDLSWAEVKAS